MVVIESEGAEPNPPQTHAVTLSFCVRVLSLSTCKKSCVASFGHRLLGHNCWSICIIYNYGQGYWPIYQCGHSSS
jgi:hypothetical protein